MTPSPALIELPAFTVAGIAVRTRNQDEMDPATARIGGLWDRFYSQSWERRLPARGEDGRVFGIYSGYESDAQGAFDVTAGVAVPPAGTGAPALAEDAVLVDVLPGRYLVFGGQGPMPQMVIDTWVRIWQYFADHPQVQRCFGTDFEAYEGPDQVAIHIGVKA